MENGICKLSEFVVTTTHIALTSVIVLTLVSAIILFLMKQEKWMFSKKSKTDEV